MGYRKIMLRNITYTILPLWVGMGTWIYAGEMETEYDGHNKKMWHYLIAPDNTRISIDNFFGPYHMPSWEELENLMMELPQARQHCESL